MYEGTRQGKAWDAWDRLVMQFGAQAFPVVMASDYVVPQGPGAVKCEHGWGDMGPSSRPCRCPGKRVGIRHAAETAAIESSAWSSTAGRDDAYMIGR